jgi:hypothetical protein
MHSGRTSLWSRRPLVFEVEVTLWPTVSRPVRLGVLPLLEQVTRCYIYLSDNYFLYFTCRAPSLTRGWVCNLQCNAVSSISSYIATDGRLFTYLFICSLFNEPDSVPSNGWTSTKNELQSMWKETVVAYFNFLSKFFFCRDWENLWNPSFRTAGVPAEVRTGHLPNIRKNRYPSWQRFCWPR